MVKGCGNRCVKYFFWLINFLFFILGGVIVGISIWLLVDKTSFTNVASSVQINLSILPLDNFYYLLYVSIAIGGALLILGFFGCCGSCCESVCAVAIYFVLVLILFIVEIVAIVLYFVNKTHLREGFVNIWRNELITKYSRNDQIRQFLDQIQMNMGCCGASGCSDYVMIGTLPSSCQCATVVQNGCASTIWATMENNLIYVAFVGIIVLFVELLAMIFSCIIISAVREKRNQEI